VPDANQFFLDGRKEVSLLSLLQKSGRFPGGGRGGFGSGAGGIPKKEPPLPPRARGKKEIRKFTFSSWFKIKKLPLHQKMSPRACAYLTFRSRFTWGKRGHLTAD